MINRINYSDVLAPQRRLKETEDGRSKNLQLRDADEPDIAFKGAEAPLSLAEVNSKLDGLTALLKLYLGQKPAQSADTDNRKEVKIGINGASGRIGKATFRQIMSIEGLGQGMTRVSTEEINDRARKQPVKLKIVAMNMSKQMSETGLVEFLQHDSVYGDFPGKLRAQRDKATGIMYLYVTMKDGQEQKIRIAEQRSVVESKSKDKKTGEEKVIKALPWAEEGVDIALDTTGSKDYKKRAGLEQHLTAGAKKAIFSAPGELDTQFKNVNPADKLDRTVVYGINDHEIQATDKTFSPASCTTTGVTPIIKLMNEKFGGVEYITMDTIHAVTASQQTTDKSVEDKKTDSATKKRSALNTIIPTTTGAAKAAAVVYPEIKGKFLATGYRVPTTDGSVANFTFVMKNDVDIKDVKKMFTEAAASPRWKNIIAIASTNATSSDMIGRMEDSIVAVDKIEVFGSDKKGVGKVVVLPVFYDNEYGYTRSLLDLTRKIGAQMYNIDWNQADSSINDKKAPAVAVTA
jgi:glyceraldehyde 3-phosphate dehydrogenase